MEAPNQYRIFNLMIVSISGSIDGRHFSDYLYLQRIVQYFFMLHLTEQLLCFCLRSEMLRWMARVMPRDGRFHQAGLKSIMQTHGVSVKEKCSTDKNMTPLDKVTL